MPSWAAAAPPASASGKFVPFATRRAGTPGVYVAREIATAVSYRLVVPASRTMSGRLTTAAASTSRGL